MTNWIPKDLERLGAAEELQLATFKKDGTRRSPVTVWVVRVGDDLYVRGYRGPETAWFRQAQRRPEGHIEAGGVTFVDASSDEVLGSEIDAAYRSRIPQIQRNLCGPDDRSTSACDHSKIGICLA